MRGMLMFAHNNELFDYGKMAYASALAATHYIDESISLVTDKKTWEKLVGNHPHAEELFEHQIFVKSGITNYRRFEMEDGKMTKAKYHNLTRLQAYELSPYDETLMIDTDVLIQDAALKNVWGLYSPLKMNHELPHILKNKPIDVQQISSNGITTLWATVFYFRKCKLSEDFFTLAEYVAKNYNYYSILYGFPSSPTRVDFILTITAHIMSGYVNNIRSVIEPLPANIMFAWNKDIIIDVERGKSTFLANDNGRPFPVSAYSTVHCMNKDSMMNMADRIIDCYA